MWHLIKSFMSSHRQTKYFILTIAIYMLAIIWTTIQSYARLDYSRSEEPKAKFIQIQSSDHS